MIIKSLSKKYKDKVVLNNVSIQIEKRRSLGIIGENGAGKSTLINCILGVTKPTKGKVEYDFQKSEIWKHIGVQLQQQEFGNLLKVK
jgi:ABC-2 type transport system ATP-binding protein